MLGSAGVGDTSILWRRLDQPGEQRYRRVDAALYRYESAGGFAAELRVNGEGFVTRYGNFWQAEG